MIGTIPSAEPPEQEHVVAPPNAVRQGPEQRLQAHEQKQTKGHDVAGDLDRDAHGVDQVFLHVRGEGIEAERATGGIAKHSEEGCLVVAEKLSDGAGPFRLAGFGAGRLLQGASEQHGNDGRECADHKRNAPAPGFQLGLVEKRLERHHHQHSQQLATNQRDVLERRIESALSFQGDFTHVGRRGAVFPPTDKPWNKREKSRSSGAQTPIRA
jgi:hypothetical protein